MKKMTRFISLLVIITIFISAFCINSSAAKTPTISNSGTRHQLCTSLSDAAKGYYTDNYTYDTLSEKSSSDILNSLRDLMKNTHSYKSSYDDCKLLAPYTDSQNSDGKIVLIYSSVSVTSKDFVSGNKGWNREHVWPKSLGGFGESGAGSDLHHVRPSDVTLNGTRSNNKYGNAPSGKAVTGSSTVSGMTGGKLSGGYFEPLDNVKGDVARICLYVYARYGGEMSKCNNITNVFQSVDVLLDWCELDPVDTWEMSRNDVVDDIQGNRNVFIDYPEYAWLIFNKEVPNDMKTPSGIAMQSNSDSNSDNSTETPDSNDSTTAPNTDETVTNDNSTTKPNETKKSETKKTDKDTSKDSSSGGCDSSIAISAICVVGIVGVMAVIKKKED